MTNVTQLSGDGDGNEPLGRDHGTILVARLHTVAEEISDLLTALGSARPGTSQERRRVAQEAKGSTAELAGICHDLEEWIAERPSGPAGANSAAEPHVPARALADVTSGQVTLDQARAELRQAVKAVRAGGASWRSVGEALGITGQAAHKRFDPRARQRHADSMRERNQRLAAKADPGD